VPLQSKNLTVKNHVYANFNEHLIFRHSYIY